MSQAEPIFVRAEGLDLYWLEGGLSGFLASPDAGLADSVALSATWADTGGLYLFLGAPAGDGAVFQAELRAWQAVQPARMLWLATPDSPSDQWQVQALGLTGQTLSRRFDIDYGGLILTVTGGSGVSLAGAAQGWGFAFAGAPAATLLAEAGALEADGPAVVTYAPGLEGCWRLALPLPATAPETPAGLEQLAASLRFFSDQPDGAIRALNLRPLIQTEASRLWASFDPLRPLDVVRTRLGFFPPADSGESADPPAFGSDYATARGYAVSLTPQQGSGLVLAVQPQTVGAPGSVPTSVYPTPIGPFGMTVSVPVQAPVHPESDIDFTPADRLLCGMSGLEYLGLAEVTGNSLVFTRPGPAYAPPALGPETEGSTLTEPLTGLGTTAWATMTAEGGVGYYAQPEEAALYSAGVAGFLNYLEVPAALLAAPTPETPGFPLAPYRGLAQADVDLARRLEARAIAPARRKAIGVETLDQARALKAESGAVATTVGVTPQGLAVGLTSIDGPWAWLGIGRNATAPDGLPDVRFTQVHGEFRQAVQTNRLFMVMGDANTVMANGSVAYRLTALALGMIGDLPEGKGVSPAVLNAVRSYVAPRNYPTYPDETAFDAMLDEATGGTITAEERLVFQRYAGQLLVSLDRWRFQLSPRNWHNPSRAAAPDSFVIFKLVGGRSLVELLDDLPSWTWPEAASAAGPAAAQSAIRSVIRRARETALTARATGAGASPYDNFVAMVDDPNWTGVLALSVDVPLDALPAPLQALAAGIDPSGFYAHHLGLTATPFSADTGQLVFQTTSSFGLIDYQDPVDQYFSEETAFAFKVLQLTVGFQNASLVSFASRVELMINRLFGATTRLYPAEHGNNLILDGVYQSQRLPDGTAQGTYVFAMRGNLSVQLTSGALEIIELRSAQLVTIKPADQAAGDSQVNAVFQLNGNLGFQDFEMFDPFCYGAPYVAAIGAERSEIRPLESYLRFSNLAISMSFSLGDQSQTRFQVADGNIWFDLANSLPRPNSLVARFPVRLAGILSTPDPAVTGQPASALTPQSAGYASISAPIQQGALGNPWYGLAYDIDLGGLGALAGNVGLKVRFLAGWSPQTGQTAPGVFIGVQLPGLKGTLGVDLPLQGILKLGFRTIQFLARDELDGRRNYVLRLRDFGIRILGLSFPPGHNDVSLFGNPDQTSNTKLGWYAAYSKAADPARRPAASVRGLTLDRRGR
jgi:hypothetical protein